MFAAPESELIRCCARKTLDPETVARIRGLVRRSIDWDYLLRLARSQGMMPLLHWHLNALGVKEVPAEMSHRLRDDFQANSRRNLFLTGKLLELLQLLRAHSIPAVPYKGPFLAQYLYGNLALREFNDLDIIVPRDRALRARELVAGCGYAFSEPPGVHKTEQSFLSWDCQFHQASPAGNFRVEIHWAIAPHFISFPIQVESLLARVGSTSFAGADVFCFRPTDLLFVLCAHGAKHRWERLEWICGVSELIRGYRTDIDWNEVVDTSERLGIRRRVFLGLHLAAEFLGAPVPAEVDEAVRRDPVVEVLGADVIRRMRAPPVAAGRFEYWLYQVRSRERAGDKMRFLGRYLVMPRDVGASIRQLWSDGLAYLQSHRFPGAKSESVHGS